MSNPYEEANRCKKVAKLVFKIEEINGGPAQPEQVAALSLAEWNQIAMLAGTTSPSETSRAAVIETLKSRQ